MNNFFKKYPTHIQAGIIVILAAAIGWQIYSGISFSRNLASLQSSLASSTAYSNEMLGNLETQLMAVRDESQKANENLAQKIATEQARGNAVVETISGIASTVGTLEKLSKTDRELLQKYSKIYFLNENYVPSRLANIDQKYLADKSRALQYHAVVLPYLTRMLDDAAAAGSPTLVSSAYRSFGTQAALKASYYVTYGLGANKFSADQGYSEHQLGTTVDLSTPTVGLDVSFEKTSASAWLKENAYRYGFELSYPKGNAYYIYEPWHWRFVGVKLATRLHNENKNFYDLDQREIDTYLASIFDPM
jgi:D-alanyl-D-alanine carboxypeptidase